MKIPFITELLQRRRERQAQKLLKEFSETFGDGACPICSYYRFGVQNGYGPNLPKRHDCPEAK